MGETRLRSLLKSISWRLVATSTTILLVLLFTGNLELAFSVGGLEVVVKMVVYYFHERAWQAFPWGLMPVVPDEAK